MLSTIIHTKRTQHSRQILCIICSSCTCICVLTTRVLPYFYFTVGVGRSMCDVASWRARVCKQSKPGPLPYSLYTSYLLYVTLQLLYLLYVICRGIYSSSHGITPNRQAPHPKWLGVLTPFGKAHSAPRVSLVARGHKRRPALVRNACAHSAPRTALLTPALWLHPVCAQAPRPTPARLRAALHRIPARYASARSHPCAPRAPLVLTDRPALVRRPSNGSTRLLTSHLAPTIMSHTGTPHNFINAGPTLANCRLPHHTRHPLDHTAILRGLLDTWGARSAPHCDVPRRCWCASAARLEPRARRLPRDPEPPQDSLPPAACIDASIQTASHPLHACYAHVTRTLRARYARLRVTVTLSGMLRARFVRTGAMRWDATTSHRRRLARLAAPWAPGGSWCRERGTYTCDGVTCDGCVCYVHVWYVRVTCA